MNQIAREVEVEVGFSDPVCGMPVTAQSQHAYEHEGKPRYLCSVGCDGNFSANPFRYLAADPAAVTYTCPMHPEVRKDHPGVCPKCRMALEPMMRTVDDGKSPALLDFSMTLNG